LKREWTIVVNIEPVGKGRPRAVNRGGFVSLYTPKKTKVFEKSVERVVRASFKGRDKIETSVAVCVFAVFKRPKNKSRKKDADGLIYKTTKPDADNVLKAVLDAMVNAGAISDDALVVDARCIKLHSEKGSDGRVIIKLACNPELKLAD
tara:strand:- start:1138 stop:1584 length:447 start_codon:yes stop_codon:yes gene_type:complete